MAAARPADLHASAGGPPSWPRRPAQGAACAPAACGGGGRQAAGVEPLRTQASTDRSMAAPASVSELCCDCLSAMRMHTPKSRRPRAPRLQPRSRTSWQSCDTNSAILCAAQVPRRTAGQGSARLGRVPVRAPAQGRPGGSRAAAVRPPRDGTLAHGSRCVRSGKAGRHGAA